MRNIKQLYQVLLDNLVKTKAPGICLAIGKLFLEGIITEEEFKVLFNHFFLTTKRPKFRFYHNFYNPKKIRKDNGFWWEQFYYPSRIEFIKKIIKSL